MSGYPKYLPIRYFSTNGVLLNAVAAAPSSRPSLSGAFVHGRRKILSEDDRRRLNSSNRRSNNINERFRQVQSDRRLLVERHREAIEESSKKDLSSIAETIEFNYTAAKDQLGRILECAADPSSLKKLNDRQISVLFQAGGVLCSNASLAFRRKYVEQLWNHAVKQGAALGILSYNAKIQADIENDVERSVVEILNDFATAGIEADELTFGLLSKMYALKGQTSGILNIIEILKEQNMPATQPLFESLVYSFAFNNEKEQVKAILQSLAANPAIDVSSLYMSAAFARARASKDVEEVLKILVDIPTSLNFDRKEKLPKMLEIIILLLESGAKDVVPKLQHYLYFDHSRGTIPYSANAEKQCLKMINAGHEAAVLELFPILVHETKRVLSHAFGNKLKESVFLPPEKAAELAAAIRGKVFSLPLSRVVEHAYAERLPIFPFYQKFIESPEFEQFQDRVHLHYPLMFNLSSRIAGLSLSDQERPELISQFFEIFSKLGTSSAPGNIQKIVRELILSEVESDERLAAFLEAHKKKSFTIATVIVDNMLFTEQLHKLEALLDGPLINEKIYAIRVLPTVMKILTRSSNLSEAEIGTLAKVIAAGFRGNNSAPENSEQRILRTIFKNAHISDERLTTLVKFFTQHPDVCLPEVQIKQIISELPPKCQTRAALLQQLRQKSKTRLRWLNKPYEELKAEAEHLGSIEDMKPGVMDTIYNSMLKKLADDNAAKNGNEMYEILAKKDALENCEYKLNTHIFIETAFKRCLWNNEMETAKKLWQMKKEWYEESKLLYVLCLLEKGENEEAETVLKSVSHIPNAASIFKIIEYNVASSEVIEKFVNIIGRKFNLEMYVRKQVRKTVKLMELRRAIDEDDLEKAFKTVTTFAEENNEIIGQLELMAACILKGKTVLLGQVYEMVASRYDRNTASIDLMIAFLECGSFQSAEQVYKRAKNLFLSNAKAEYLIDRETKLKRPDVLHKLFLICSDPDNMAPLDAQIMLKVCMELYAKNQNLDGLKELQHNIEKAKFVDDLSKVKAHLETLIAKVSSEKQQPSRGRSASTPAAAHGKLHSSTRNNSVFEAHDEKPPSDSVAASTAAST